MDLPKGSVPYPESADPNKITQLASTLVDITERLTDVNSRLRRISATASTTWQGDAAVTFADHMTDRADGFDIGRCHVVRAVRMLHEYAAAVQDNAEWYARYAETELFLRREPQPRQEKILEAIANQEMVVRDLQQLGDTYGSTIAAIAAQLDVPNQTPTTGRDLIADALTATENGTIRIDQIQIQKLSDGSYVIVLPGVTDLGDLSFLTGTDNGSIRRTKYARPTALQDAVLNRYAEKVKIAMQRYGIPPGSEVTFVGHSFGNYTAMDLAGQDAFNSADGTSDGYHVKVRRVVGVAADTDWKVKRVPSQTDVIVLNSRDDSVYQVEAQLDPEPDWMVRGDRVVVPKPIPSVPLPPVVTYPTGRPNQIEVEVNAGRSLDGEDKLSGHHPKRYAPFIRAKERNPMGPVLDQLDGTYVVSRDNVRVPDRVPPVKAP